MSAVWMLRKEDVVKTFVVRAAAVALLQLMIVVPLFWLLKSVM